MLDNFLCHLFSMHDDLAHLQEPKYHEISPPASTQRGMSSKPVVKQVPVPPAQAGSSTCISAP